MIRTATAWSWKADAVAVLLSVKIKAYYVTGREKPEEQSV